MHEIIDIPELIYKRMQIFENDIENLLLPKKEIIQ